MTVSSVDPTSDTQRAEALCGLGRFGEAVELLRRVLAANPDYFPAWCLLSSANISLGSDDAALDAARHAAALDPDEQWPHQLMSLAHSRLLQHREAVQQAKEAARLAPQFWATHVRLAYAWLGANSNLPEAHAAAKTACELGPLVPETHVCFGAIAAAQRRDDEAESAFRHALALDPGNSTAHNALARLQLRSASSSTLGGFVNARGLSNAATGFAAAVRADPHSEVSRRNLDLVIRSFLSRTAYFVFLDALFVGRAVDTSASIAARLIPLALLAIAGSFAWKFVWRLPPDLRRYLKRAVLHGRTAVGAGAETLAILALMAGAFSREAARPVLLGAAAVLALVGRVVLIYDQQHAARNARLATASTAARSQIPPVIGDGVLRFLAYSLGFGAAVTLVLGLVAISSSLAAALGLTGVAALLGVLAVFTVRAIRRRQRNLAS